MDQGKWESDKGVARAMLRDRGQRRRLMTRLLVVVVAQLIFGAWVIDGWLAENPWRFVIWWAACAFLALFLLIFAAYDFLAVMREERGGR